MDKHRSSNRQIASINLHFEEEQVFIGK